ncbi:hypothetical protein QYN14_25570 [Rhodococcus ruber]|uniref:hypothetical protein n=1 Tax=Rhodococcus ruber TaxID=1830 RepID=UPI0026582F7C|nr:hypothetical protein [Rhodococcus ruber]WKK11918.1 hypothetical protein QYN14_25150 [Rhodococcus ruber]WKK12002.1 hypothetical protein QYN14_25570 [Rhodococcus ruber]
MTTTDPTDRRTRRVLVTVTETREHIALVDIDDTVYLTWLDGDDDTPAAVREFLEAGSDLDDIIDAVVADATPVTDIGITDVTHPESES